MHLNLCQGWDIEAVSPIYKVWNGRRLVATLKDTPQGPHVIWGRLSEIMLPLVIQKIKQAAA